MRRLLPLALALAVSACSAFRASPPEPHSYRLAYPPPAPAYDTPAGIVRVGPFTSAQVYDRLGFVYRDGTYGVGIDNYNAWIASPAGMLADLVARDLVTSRAASAVLQGPSAMTPDYELSARVEEIDERETGGCTAHLRLRALFVHIDVKAPRQVLFEDIFASDQPCTPGDPSSFAEAMSKAAEDVSTQVIGRGVARCEITVEDVEDKRQKTKGKGFRTHHASQGLSGSFVFCLLPFVF
jgi:uncharacterized lipoprotein YmbA